MAHNTEQSMYVKQHTMLNHVQMYDISKVIYN